MSSNISPNSQGLSAARNPRRRQRNSTDDLSARQQQPQRKRHKTGGDSFKSTVEKKLEDPYPQVNGNASHKQDSVALLAIPVRGKHTPRKRSFKDEGSVTLTQNANYVVKQLPSLPEHIRINKRESHRGFFSPATEYALVVTRTEAFVWDYNSASSTPSTRVFALQHPSKQSEPLPLGVLVSSSAGTDTGLIVINATSGKITYWESIENAEALSLFEQRRNGIIGSCGSLLSGETLADVERAEPTGYLLRFTSGRIAHLLLRDAQGRPSIAVHFLESVRSKTAAGFFGGLKSVFGASHWLKDVVATRMRPSDTRGYTDAVVASKDGQFQIWQLGWTGQSLLQHDVDGKPAIEATITSTTASAEGQATVVSVADFAISSISMPESTAIVLNGEGADTSIFFDLVVLIAITNDVETTYALVEVELTSDSATARRTIPLHSSTPPAIDEGHWSPRVFLPGVADTAFVVFEKSVTLVSLATVKISPEAQILMDAHSLPEPYQDTLRLKDDRPFSIVGASGEGLNGASPPSSIVLLVENCGLVRITTVPPISDEQAIQRSRVSAKSKIEQAVYFGSLTENPLDLFHISQQVMSLDEVEKAALQISHEVLATKSQFLPTVAPSMEFHLEQRARILKHLATYLKQFQNVSRLTRWRLRWDAEKIAAARKLWSVYNDRLSTGNKETILLPKLLFALNDNLKTQVDSDSGERDVVRQYFLKDIWRLEYLPAAPISTINYLSEEEADTMKDVTLCLQYYSDGSDIILSCHETAFTFRTDNSTLYGLQDEVSRDGVIQSGYEGMPEFWTSTSQQQRTLSVYINHVRDKLHEAGGPTAGNVQRAVAKALPRLINIYCKGAEERSRWYSASTELTERRVADEFRTNYEKERSSMIRKLRHVDLTQDAFTLAKKYRDMYALVVLVQTSSSPELLEKASRGDGEAKGQVIAIEKRVRSYFESYGDEWANVFYNYQLSQGAYAGLLDQAALYGANLTGYLRASKSRKKLSWINDVLSERDYTAAGQALLSVAEKQESDLWSKKVQLSIAKLALIAGPPSSATTTLEQSHALGLVKIQERIYEHIRPCFYDAVDQRAELQLAMDAFGAHTGKNRPALHQLLERGLESIIAHSAMDVDQLIDVLTLMDHRSSELKGNDIAGHEMYLAMDALRLAGSSMTEDKRDLRLKFIYRRCFIRDDWRSLDGAARKSDQDAMDQLEATSLFKTIYEGHSSGLWNGNSGIRLLLPADVLGAGTTPDEHRYRFNATDIREPIAKDMATEDGVLQNCITKYRLVHWVTTAEELAKERLRKEADSKVERGKKIQRVVTQLEGENMDLQKYKGEKNESEVAAEEKHE